MSKAPTTTSYSGRTVDLLLLSLVDRPVSDKTVVPDVSVSPMAVAGIEKLVQRYAQLFLTSAGTVRNRPDDGTDLITRLQRGQIRDERTLRDSAEIANSETMRQIRAADFSTSIPDDEALERSDVIGVSIDRPTASVTIEVKITSMAGTSYTYVMPIPTGV